MAFPQTDFNIEVKLDLNGDGVPDTDITSYVLARDGSNGLDIRRGGSPEGGLSDPGTCDFQLNNRDGRFSPRNPNGPYYGQIGRNSAIQVGVKGGPTYLQTLNVNSAGASTPDSASLSITGDIDIRFDATLDNWFAAGGFGGTAELCGKGEFSAASRAWILMIRDDVLRFEWSADGTNITAVSSTAKPLVPLSRRLAVRVTLDVDNGAGGSTATFYTAPTMAGPWTQLGASVVTAGVTSIFNDSNAVNVGRGWPLLGFDSAVGRIHSFQLRSGIAGSLVASPDFTVQTDGATSFVDAQGNTWTRAAFPDSNITDLDVRFVGEITSWPNRWDTSGRDIWVDIKAKGVLRRLDSGRSTLDSTLRRSIPSALPVAYWPMEDGADATSFYTPIEGVLPMPQHGMDLSSNNTLGGSLALPAIREGAEFRGTLPATGSSVNWKVEFVYYAPTVVASDTLLLTILANGTARRIDLNIRDATIHVVGSGLDETLPIDHIAAPFSNTDIFGRWVRLSLTATTNGANTDFAVGVIPVGGSGLTSSFSITGSPGRVTGIEGRSGGYLASSDGIFLGHITVFDDVTSTAFNSADTGYDGERASTRFNRLCDEEGVPAVIHAWSSETTQMGPQGPSTFLNLLRDAADADEGLLVEARESMSVKFIGLSSLTNQGPTVTITYPDDIQPGLMPEPDDLNVENDVSVSRSSGSTGNAQVTSGPLSVNAPPLGVGRYESSYELDLYSDFQVAQHAGWKAHLGTWDEERYSGVPVWVSATPSLFGVLSALDVGTTLRITNNQNADHKLPPGDIDLLIKGYDEFLNQRRWEFLFNGVPYGPYRVGVADDATLGRCDTEGSELVSAVTSTATSFTVYTTSGPVWTKAGAEYPFDLMVGGERVTATACTSGILDAFGRTTSNGWGTADIGGAWTNSGGSASDYSTNGTVAQVSVSAVNSSRLTYISSGLADIDITVQVATDKLATGGPQYSGITARYQSLADLYHARLGFQTDQSLILTLQKRVASVGTDLTTVTVPGTHAAGTYYNIRFKLNGSSLMAKAWQVGSAEPEWQATATDTSITAAGAVGTRSYLSSLNTNVLPVTYSYDNFEMSNPQIMTVTRSVNGIVKAQSAAADIRLADPMIAALI